SAIASRISGKAIIASISRDTTLSAPRKNPATRPRAMPSTPDSSTTRKPTSSDSRPPWMTRLNTSRPKSSVPNQCSALGACRRFMMESLYGSNGLIQGASAAAATSTASTTRLASTVLRATSRRTACQRSAHGPEEIAIATAVAHSRNDQQVQQVDEKVDQDIDGGNDQQRALDDRVVAPQHRRHHQAAYAGQAKHGFGDHRAADQQSGGQPQHRQYRDQRIARRVLQDHL